MELLLVIPPVDIKLGLIIALVGILIVFTALAVMSLIFNQIPKFFKNQKRSKLLKEGKIKDHEECCTDLSGETNAAIALALHLYMSEMHDMESNVITIEKVSRRYSPWNSKIYGLRNLNFNK